MSKLTAERLRELLSYDHETGIFSWKVRRQGASHNVPAGYFERSDGYWRIKVDGVLYSAHRLAFLIQVGEWPTCEVDHINGNRVDNRWDNLRLATSSQNKHNGKIHRDNKAGLKGIHARRGGWRATIKHDGKNHHLGDFASKEAAHAAYLAAANNLHGEFARSG